MPLRNRVRDAVNALMGKGPGIGPYAAATVRNYETNAWSQRSKQTTHADLCNRFCGTVKVACSRNSTAIASLPLRLYKRRASPGAKTAWETRGIPRQRMLYLKHGAGQLVQKAAARFEDMEEVVDPLHPLLKLLDRANTMHAGFDLIELTQDWLGLTGNAYWWVPREGEDAAAYPLAPQYTRVLPSREGVIGGYVYGRGTENEKTYSPDEIVHFKYANPRGDPFYGFGDLAAVVREADLSVQFKEMAQAMLDNGGLPGLVITAEGMTKDQRIEAEAELERRTEGVRNTGRTLLLNGQGVKVIPWNLSEKEIAFLNSDARMEGCIALGFDLPPSVLRLEGGAALATAEESMPQWQKFGIKPRAKRIENTLNQRVVRGIFGLGDEYVLAFDDPETRDMVSLSTRICAEYAAGLVTQNEGRMELGYDAVEGGDEFKAAPDPLGFGFGGQGDAGDGKGACEGKPGAGGDDADKPGDGEDKGEKSGGHVHPRRRARPRTRVTAATLSAAALFLSPAHDCHAKCGDRYGQRVTKDDRDKFNVIESSARELEAALRRWFNGNVTPRVMDGVTLDGLSVNLSADDGLRASFLNGTREQLERLFVSGFNHGVSDVSSRTRMSYMATLTEPARARMVSFQSRAFVSTTDSVTSAVRHNLADGLEAGESIPELQARVQEVMTGASNYGAERIARTESARSYLTSREDAWVESGVVAGKEWLLSADPCEFCLAMHEKYRTAAVGVPFIPLGGRMTGTEGGSMDIDYAALDTPPLHPGCRCSLGAIFKE